MASFDHITSDDLRLSLENDYHELQISMDSGAFKAVHVLAGSIVEAILVDSLIAIDFRSRMNKDPLTMTFEKLIDSCRDEQIITRRAAELSTVIRTYRNLIHPARAIRLNEAIDENSAKVAQALVEIILNEVVAQRAKTLGYTAQQILTKIESDASVSSILIDILRQMNTTERDKLLILIPNRYNSLDEDEDILLPGRLEQAFRLVFNLSSDETKQKITSSYARLVKEGGDWEISNYATRFFILSDIIYLEESDKKIVKKYIIHRIPSLIQHNHRVFSGIGAYITEEDVQIFTDACVRSVAFENNVQIMNKICQEYVNMREDIAKMFDDRLDSWDTHSGGRQILADAARLIKQAIIEDIPF